MSISGETYRLLGRAIQCLKCGRVSWNPNDVAYLYCGYCHQFHDSSAVEPWIDNPVVGGSNPSRGTD